MKKYSVGIPYVLWVSVEADDESQAKDKAFDEVSEYPDWHTNFEMDEDLLSRPTKVWCEEDYYNKN